MLQMTKLFHQNVAGFVDIRVYLQNHQRCSTLTTSNHRHRLVAIVTRHVAPPKVNHWWVSMATMHSPAPLTATTTTHVCHLPLLY